MCDIQIYKVPYTFDQWKPFGELEESWLSNPSFSGYITKQWLQRLWNAVRSTKFMDLLFEKQFYVIIHDIKFSKFRLVLHEM